MHRKLHKDRRIGRAVERCGVRLFVVLRMAAGSMFKSMLPCAAGDPPTAMATDCGPNSSMTTRDTGRDAWTAHTTKSNSYWIVKHDLQCKLVQVAVHRADSAGRRLADSPSNDANGPLFTCHQHSATSSPISSSLSNYLHANVCLVDTRRCPAGRGSGPRGTPI